MSAVVPFRIPLLISLAALPAAAAFGQSCNQRELEATKIEFEGDHLPIEQSGFFPYLMSGGGPAEKYTVESWSGNSDKAVYPACGCETTFTNIMWGGSWTFSKSTFADTSSKALNYTSGGCGASGPQQATQMKVGIAPASSSALSSPGATTVAALSRQYQHGEFQGPSSCTPGLFWGPTNVTESLSEQFSFKDAVDRAENFKTPLPVPTNRQYWNYSYPRTAAEAATLLANGTIGRTTPIVAHAERIRFRATFAQTCLGPGRYLITFYYKRWPLDAAEPAEFETKTETIDFRDEPVHTFPVTGDFHEYHFPIKQGEQCKLVKVTAVPLEQCANTTPGDAKSQVGSVDQKYFLGRLPDGGGAGMLLIAADRVSPALYQPSTLQLRAPASITAVHVDGALRQVAAPEVFVDVVTTSVSSYELRFYYSSQVGALDTGTGLYAVSGQPFVTHVVENPDAGSAANRVRFTETRGATAKQTVFAYTAATGTLSMDAGGGLRKESLARTVNGSTITETRTITNAADQPVSVVRETRQAYLFGEQVTQQVLDPDGAARITTYTYYTDPATDGGAYGQVKLMVEPTGRWTRYTYDTQNRRLSVVTQFLDTVSTSADNLNRATRYTYTTVPDQDGDGIAENLTTQVEQLLGVEIARQYRLTFSKLEPVLGTQAEMQWTIVCTAAGAAWDATGNLVTKTRRLTGGDWSGRTVSELRPDGTLTTASYSVSGSTRTVTTETGAANPAAATVVAGTRTVVGENLFGRMQTRGVTDIASGLTLSSEAVSATDAFGRPTRIDFADGTFELRSYACCGLDMQTDRQGVATHFEFDALGRVQSESRAGITQHNTLDPVGRIVARERIGSDNSTMPLESHQYDLAGRLQWSKDALNRQTSMAYSTDASGHPVETTTTPAGTIVRTLARDGSVLSVTGTAAAQRLAYEYGVDADGTFTKEIRVGSGGETTEWVKTYTDFAGRPFKKVYADGATETSYYNAAGQLARQVDADGVTTLFAYDAEGNLELTAIDLNANGVIDAAVDRLTRTRQSVATRGGTTVRRVTTESWETAGADSPVTIAVSEQSFDGFHAWQAVRGVETQVSTVFDGAGGRTVTETRPDGSKQISVFSQDRLVSATVQTSGNVTVSAMTYGYDPHGRLQTVTDARTGTTTYTYFGDDQMQTITTPDPDPNRSGTGYDPQTTTFGYDSAGQQSTVTAPDGGVVTTTYWPTGQVKRTSGSRTYPVEYAYDSQGRLKTLTTWRNYAGNSGTAVTTWNYSPTRGLLANKRHADNTGPNYTYTPAGRLQTRTWARGVSTTYAYNAAGNMTGWDYSDATPDVTLTPDRTGRTVAITDASGTRSLTYGGYGLLEDEDYTGGPLVNQGVHRHFDALGRLDQLDTWTNGAASQSVAYEYDALSRLHTVTAGTRIATYAYVPNANLLGSVMLEQGGVNRLVRTATYDQLNRLESMANTPAVGVPQSFTYTYDPANKRTQAVRQNAQYWDYGYDNLGQVTSAVKRVSGGTALPGFSQAFAFDDIGNRQTATRNGQAATYTPNNLNQYTQRTVPGVVEALGSADPQANVTVNGQPTQRLDDAFYYAATLDNVPAGIWAELRVAGLKSGAGPAGADATLATNRYSWLPQTPEVFQYDADGNLTADGRWSYTWDGENRLIRIETKPALVPPSGHFPLSQRRRIDFSYDGQGRRIQKDVSNWTGTGWTLTRSTRFLYDGWNLIAECNALAANSVVRTYEWGLDLSGSMQGAGGVGGLLFATATTAGSAATLAAEYDGNGNVAGYVDLASGVRAASFDYGPFGEILLSDGWAKELLPFGFSTKYSDVEAGLVYYGLRYYSPSLGRWINRDPLEESGGTGLYLLVGNSPTTTFDPLGLASFEDLVKDRLLGTPLGKFQKGLTAGPFPVPSPAGPIPLYVSGSVEGNLFLCTSKRTGKVEIWFEGAINLEGYARWGRDFDDRPRYPEPKGRDRNRRSYDRDYTMEQMKNKNRTGRLKDPFFRDQGLQFDLLNNRCRICPDGSTKFAVKAFARTAVGAGFGFYANFEKELYSTEELAGFQWNAGLGRGIHGAVAEIGLNAQLANITFQVGDGGPNE
ncbi:MAG: RHS repeat-associated core domain-containing protein [Candidatus Didemnitutus sp.]|nr:RHS repeat-associated core domain-containing protein [Candidatus Didemnitutus sp.]